MYNKIFWKDTGERAVKTFIQTLLALLLVGGGFNAFVFDWSPALQLAFSAGVISVLTSAVSAGKRDSISPASAVSPE